MNLESLNNPYKTILMAQDKDQKTLNVPPLRFPGFTDEWKKCLVSDYGDIVTGTTPSTNQEENYSNGEYLWASPSDLGTEKYIYTTQTRLSKKGFDKTRPLPPKAILVTCIGSTIGKMGMAKNKMSTNQQINSIIVNGAYDADFVYYAIQSKFPRYISSIAVQAVPILSKSEFGKLYNVRTSVEEQMKIGEFLSKIDERIETQNKIIEDLQSLIKGLAKTLTHQEEPNVRISDCLECHTSTLQEGSLNENEQYPVYGASGIAGYLDDYRCNEDSILIIKDGSGAGTVSYATGEYSVIGTLNYLTAKSGYSLNYLYFCLMGFNFEPFKTGMAIPHIYFKDYGKAKIYCPSIEEQGHIAKALTLIEDKLNIETQLLKSLYMEKQYLLNNMFI